MKKFAGSDILSTTDFSREDIEHIMKVANDFLPYALKEKSSDLLKDKLMADVKEALKSGNSQKRMTLGMVLSAVKGKELDKRGRLSKTDIETAKLEEASKLTDEEIIEVLSSEIKKRKEAIDQYEKAGRPELAQQEKEELVMLMEYMPEQMSDEAVMAEVKNSISEIGASGPKDMGKVIGSVMAKVKGRADGNLVSKLVKEELQKSA